MTPLRPTETPSVKTLTGPADTTNLPLVKRVRSGVSWNVSSSLIGQLISFVRSVVLARLLAPEDFGVFAMALTIVAALNALRRQGDQVCTGDHRIELMMGQSFQNNES